MEVLANLTASACPQELATKFGIAAHQRQVQVYAHLARQLLGSEPTVCEVGFNCGHSSATLLEANPRLRVINFDKPAPAASWATPARMWMRQRYGDRIEVIDGPSSTTVPQYRKEHPSLSCDMVIIDGEHHYVPALLDLVQVLQSARHVCSGSKHHAYAVDVMFNPACRPYACLIRAA